MANKNEALEKIKALVARFKEQRESYKSSDYNETQARRDFIDPMFKALGWDVDNENGYAESYREVIHEDRLKIEGRMKAPDYSFRLGGGKRLFFLEAKKPSVFIYNEIVPAYQVRRYGWSAKMPISVITDFEEFAIYDCTVKPNQNDKASVARIKYMTYEQYVTEFDFLWNTFAKECVLKGSFDKYIASDSNKKGTATVDVEFLKSLDSWRILLAENIAAKNKKLSEDELNFIVQHIIDRIIFLRIAEDRKIETYGNLQTAAAKGDCYKNLLTIFHEADQKYNSGLFDFSKDNISESINIDNKTMRSIIADLYYPNSPYEFSVLSVEILGSAYEQFLGKQIVLTAKGKAEIEEKPEVRKAGGVYYTPQYIVDYIVQNTIGKLVEGKTPDEVTNLKIVDPACGSGSFLIGVYSFLLDWHKKYYSEEKLNKKSNSPLTPNGTLSTAEKKRILLNNIYGVDLDVNAVEVTKLSLLLKCMEGETEASIETQIKMFHERVLPTLDNNIKSGNSLIDLDFYDTQLDFKEDRKIKPFSWKNAFPEVFKNKTVSEELKIFHITWVMHNVRTSKRMLTYDIQKSSPEFLNQKDEHKLIEILAQIILEDKIRILAINISADHLHFVIACNPENLPNIVSKMKTKSARAFNIWRGITTVSKETNISDKGACPLAITNKKNRGTTQNSLWAQKFNRVAIEDEEQLYNAINYVNNNRLKHKLEPLTNETENIIRSILVPISEAFKPRVIYGGFDAVIGNPPYVRIHELNEQAKNYYRLKYKSASNQFDLYQLFYERGIELVNVNGLVGFITSNKFCITNYGKTLRHILFHHTCIRQIIDCSKSNVFGKVSTYPFIFILSKEYSEKNQVKLIENIAKDFNIDGIKNQDTLLKGMDDIFVFGNADEVLILLDKIESDREKNLFVVYRGRGTSKDLSTTGEIKCITNKEIQPYRTIFQTYYRSENKYLNDFEPKIMMKKICFNLECSLDVTGEINPINTVYVIKPISSKLNIMYLLAILNSKLMSFYARKKYQTTAMRGGYIELRVFEVAELPIKIAGKQQHDEIVKHVENLLQFNAELQTATLPTQKDQLKNRITYSEDKINALVYGLYGLSAEEIGIVEGKCE